MARQTRAERRARRQQATQEPALAGAGGGGGAKPPARLAPEPPAKPDRGREESRPGFFTRLGRFIVESWGELRKTEWPSQNHVIQGTIVVLVACIILGTFIWLCDIAFKHLVQDVLIK